MHTHTVRHTQLNCSEECYRPQDSQLLLNLVKFYTDPPNDEIHKWYILYNSTSACNMQMIFSHPDCFQAMYKTVCGAKVRPVTSVGFFVWVNSSLSAMVAFPGGIPQQHWQPRYRIWEAWFEIKFLACSFWQIAFTPSHQLFCCNYFSVHSGPVSSIY